MAKEKATATAPAPAPAPVAAPAATSNHKVPDKVGIIPVSKIRQNVVALRPVEKESVAYLELADSVKKNGVMTPIVVREFENPENKGEILYGLIDGLQRYNAALDAGITELAAKITDKNQAEIEELQIILNVQKIETKPIRYADQIDRLLQRNPTMSMIELSGRLSKSTTWIYKILGMAKRLHPDIKPLVDDQKINLANSCELAKLPAEEQAQWVDKAQTMATGEFTANIAKRMKEIREARAKGRAESPPTFAPAPNQRKWAEVKAEYEHGCPNLMSYVGRLKLTKPEDIVKLCVSWAARMDPDAQAEQKAAHEAAEAKRKADNEAKKLERTKQKEAEAQKTRADLEAKIKAREEEQKKQPETAAAKA